MALHRPTACTGSAPIRVRSPHLVVVDVLPSLLLGRRKLRLAGSACPTFVPFPDRAAPQVPLFFLWNKSHGHHKTYHRAKFIHNKMFFSFNTKEFGTLFVCSFIFLSESCKQRFLSILFVRRKRRMHFCKICQQTGNTITFFQK